MVITWQNVGSTSNNNFIFPAQIRNFYNNYMLVFQTIVAVYQNHQLMVLFEDTMSPNNPIIHDVSVDSNGKSTITWSSSSTDVDVYAIYILDEDGSWVTIDSVFGLTIILTHIANSDAINKYETFSIRSIDSCGNASNRSLKKQFY